MTEGLQRLREQDWQGLIYRIYEGRKCTPIVGTGMISEMCSLRSAIAQEWALKENYPLQDSNNLARVARFLSLTRFPEYPRQELLKQMATIEPPKSDDPDNPYRILAELPLPLYITTAYDDLMFQALKRADKDARSELCRWNDSLSENPSILDDGFEPNVANPVVFNIHGQADNLDSLVLTEDDYFEFLIYVSKFPKTIPHRIQRAFSGTSLLLLGFSLSDWDFRVMFHLLASSLERQTERNHVAVQISPVPDEAPEDQKKRAKEYLDIYLSKYKSLDMRIYWGTSREFLMELRDRRKMSHANQ